MIHHHHHALCMGVAGRWWHGAASPGRRSNGGSSAGSIGSSISSSSGRCGSLHGCGLGGVGRAGRMRLHGGIVEECVGKARYQWLHACMDGCHMSTHNEEIDIGRALSTSEINDHICTRTSTFIWPTLPPCNHFRETGKQGAVPCPCAKPCRTMLCQSRVCVCV